MGKIAIIKKSFNSDLVKVDSREELERIKIKYLGRKGEIIGLSKTFGSLSASQKKDFGQKLNELKKHIEAGVSGKERSLKGAASKAEAIDITAPGSVFPEGHLHPVTQFLTKATKIFKEMGFEIYESPEIDIAFYNFDALNVPKDHPARDSWDTFYIDDKKDIGDDDKLLLRTHTSNSQVRSMQDRKPPVRIIAPGKCYRNEATDASHETTFYQLEGFVIDEGIAVTDLVGTLTYFAKKMFGNDVKTRFRPHFYPFTEVSIDMDISCLFCEGKGCSFCKQSGWIEVMPCGMIHPNVLKNMGVDRNKYSGFAFGFGIDRLTMLYYGIDDMRLIHSGDLRFMEQF